MSSSNWKALGKTLIKKGLPLLGSVITGPAGVAVNSVAAIISSVTGEEPDNPEAMHRAISQQPELLLQLKKAEIANREKLASLALQHDQMYLNDVQDARDREVQITQATGERDRSLQWLAWTVVIGFLGMVLALSMISNPFANSEYGLLMLGALATGFGTVLNYHFGSSRGSKNKDAVIEQLQSKLAALLKQPAAMNDDLKLGGQR